MVGSGACAQATAWMGLSGEGQSTALNGALLMLCSIASAGSTLGGEALGVEPKASPFRFAALEREALSSISAFGDVEVSFSFALTVRGGRA